METQAAAAVEAVDVAATRPTEYRIPVKSGSHLVGVTFIERNQARDELHLVDGLLIAILDIDEVIQLIRSSDNAAQARERLMSVFDLSEVQANHILDMQLRRLTQLEGQKLRDELGELQATIKELESILKSKTKLRTVIKKELAEIRKDYADERKTLPCEMT